MDAKLNYSTQQPTSNQSGFMMIEVLVAILLFSVGLLGLVALQTSTAQNATNAEYRSIAASLSNELVSQMWIKKTADPSSSALSGDITTWKNKVATSGLPNAIGEVQQTGNVTSVIVRYKLPSKTGAENSNRFLTQVVIP